MKIVSLVVVKTQLDHITVAIMKMQELIVMVIYYIINQKHHL